MLTGRAPDEHAAIGCTQGDLLTLRCMGAFAGGCMAPVSASTGEFGFPKGRAHYQTAKVWEGI